MAERLVFRDAAGREPLHENLKGHGAGALGSYRRA